MLHRCKEVDPSKKRTAEVACPICLKRLKRHYLLAHIKRGHPDEDLDKFRVKAKPGATKDEKKRHRQELERKIKKTGIDRHYIWDIPFQEPRDERKDPRSSAKKSSVRHSKQLSVKATTASNHYLTRSKDAELLRQLDGPENESSDEERTSTCSSTPAGDQGTISGGIASSFTTEPEELSASNTASIRPSTPEYHQSVNPVPDVSTPATPITPSIAAGPTAAITRSKTAAMQSSVSSIPDVSVSAADYFASAAGPTSPMPATPELNVIVPLASEPVAQCANQPSLKYVIRKSPSASRCVPYNRNSVARLMLPVVVKWPGKVWPSTLPSLAASVELTTDTSFEITSRC